MEEQSCPASKEQGEEQTMKHEEGNAEYRKDDEARERSSLKRQTKLPKKRMYLFAPVEDGRKLPHTISQHGLGLVECKPESDSAQPPQRCLRSFVKNTTKTHTVTVLSLGSAV